MSYIEIKNIEKHFGTTIAVKNISISLEKNKIYGLLGRNGAGKSTLLYPIIWESLYSINFPVCYYGYAWLLHYTDLLSQ